MATGNRRHVELGNRVWHEDMVYYTAKRSVITSNMDAIFWQTGTAFAAYLLHSSYYSTQRL